MKAKSRKRFKGGGRVSYLGIDIGGTYIKYAVFDHEGLQLCATERQKTQVTASSNHILDQVCQICRSTQEQYPLQGVAISTAGVVDSQKGLITYAGYTIPGYTGTPLKERVEALTRIKCTVINDVNAACLGEYWKTFTDVEKPKTLVCLTIGTGVGGAIIIDGKLYEGPSFMAGEVGYLPIEGQYFQDLASTTALLSDAKRQLKEEISGEEFFKRLRFASDQGVQQVFDRFISALAKGLLIMQYTLNPDQIVLGGGIMAQHDIIIPAVEQKLKALAVSERFLTAKISPARAGNNAGMLGALYFHLY